MSTSCAVYWRHGADASGAWRLYGRYASETEADRICAELLHQGHAAISGEPGPRVIGARAPELR